MIRNIKRLFSLNHNCNGACLVFRNKLYLNILVNLIDGNESFDILSLSYSACYMYQSFTHSAFCYSLIKDMICYFLISFFSEFAWVVVTHIKESKYFIFEVLIICLVYILESIGVPTVLRVSGHLQNWNEWVITCDIVILLISIHLYSENYVDI